MIDAHLHLWRLDTGWYGWNTPDLGPVHGDSVLAEVIEQLPTLGITGAVVVQAADTLAETDWLLDLADAESRILGVVGYLPLQDPTELGQLLDRYADRPLAGVRQLWHDHHPDELAREETITGLRLLGEVGLPVDVPDAHPRLWAGLRHAVEQAPETTFVLDHCGKPPFGDPLAWRTWERHFCDLATRANVVVKLSGLFGGSGSAIAASDQELRRVVGLARSSAGPARTMAGSDWPLTRGRIDYVTTWRRLERLLADWDTDERERVLAGTAQATYQLSVDSGR